MGLYCLLLNKTSWWKLEYQSKFQIFREHALFCLVRHSSLDQSTAQEAKDISEKMVARGLLLPFRWEWVSWRKDSVAGKIVLLNSLLSVDGTLNTWLEARDPRITGTITYEWACTNFTCLLNKLSCQNYVQSKIFFFFFCSHLNRIFQIIFDYR